MVRCLLAGVGGCSLGSLPSHGRESRADSLDGSLDVFFSVGQRDVELLSRLDNAALKERPGERGMERPVAGEGGPVLRNGPVREVALEDRGLSGDLSLKARR